LKSIGPTGYEQSCENDSGLKVPVLMQEKTGGFETLLKLYVAIKESNRPSGPGARLALLIHHDDAEREVAYDREFRLSPLVEALDKANEYGIRVVRMKRDWKAVFGDTRT
jgi:hypothetical protein